VVQARVPWSASGHYPRMYLTLPLAEPAEARPQQTWVSGLAEDFKPYPPQRLWVNLFYLGSLTSLLAEIRKLPGGNPTLELPQLKEVIEGRVSYWINQGFGWPSRIDVLDLRRVNYSDAVVWSLFREGAGLINQIRGMMWHDLMNDMLMYLGVDQPHKLALMGSLRDTSPDNFLPHVALGTSTNLRVGTEEYPNHPQRLAVGPARWHGFDLLDS
jgi:hypothetical protein